MSKLINELWESDEASALTNRAARRIQALEEALKNLVSATDAASWEYNFCMCDDALEEARIILSSD